MTKRLKTTVLGLFTLLALFSCASKGTRKSDAPSRPQYRSFPAGPAVPSVVSDPAEIMDWTVSHFWDAFTDISKIHHCDSSIVNGVRREELDNAMLLYARMLNQCSFETAVKSVSNLFDKAEAFEASDPSTNVFEYFVTTVSGFLYDPNSMFRNEDLYLPFVSKLSLSEYADDSLRSSYAYDARMCSLNRYGEKAADFSFTLTDGKKMRLHGIKAEWTILLFSNPGCKACEEIYSAFAQDSVLPAMVKSGKVAVANVYIDEELDKWLGYCSSYPSEWYNGYDQDYVVRKDQLYSVRAIPSLYLLDSQKRIVMKDAPVEKVLPFLGAVCTGETSFEGF